MTSNIIKSYGNLSLTNEYNENPKSHCFLIFFLKTIFNDFANFDQLKAKDYKWFFWLEGWSVFFLKYGIKMQSLYFYRLLKIDDKTKR